MTAAVAGTDARASEVPGLAVVAGGCIATLALGLASLALARSTGGLTLIWLCNAYAACLLLAWPRRSWPLLLGVTMLGVAAANRAFGVDWEPTLAYTFVNGAEALLAAVLMQRFAPDVQEEAAGPLALARTLLFGALLPALGGATLAALLISRVLGIPPAPLWLGWAVSATLGSIIVLPLGRRLAERGWAALAGVSLPRLLLTAAGVAVASALPMLLLSRPYIWVSVVVVLCAATLPFQAAAACTAVAALVISVTRTLGQSSVLWLPGDMVGAAWGGIEQALVLVPGLLLAAQRAQSLELRSRLDHLFERATDGIMLGRPDGTLVAANPAAQRLLGHDAATLLRRHRTEVLDITDERLARLLDERQRTGSAAGSLRGRRADGSVFEAEISSAVYQLPSGVWVTHTFFRDVTERLLQQQALQASDELLRRLSERVPGVLCKIEQGPGGHLHLPWASDAIEPLLGVTREQVAQSMEPLFGHLHPEDALTLRRALAESAAQETLFKAEFRVTVPGRPLRWVAAHAMPRILSDGTLQWHGYMADVTERREQEERRREDQVRTELAVLAGGIGTWDADMRTGVNVANERWYTMLGYVPGEVPGTVEAFRALVHPDDLAAVNGVERWQLAQDGLKAPPMVVRLRHKSGEWRWIEIRSMITERDPASGERWRMSGTHIDVTERVQAEALRAARDRAEAANHAKSVFMSRMSHELRTPLNAVLGFAQLLEADPERRLTATQQAHVAHVLGASEHLLALIDELLDLSRIESGELALQTAPVPVAQALQAALSAVQGQADGLGIRLSCAEIEPGLAVMADRRRLHQVMLNLLSNGIKYNRPHGSLRLAVTLPPVAGAGRVGISVIDSGPGLTAAQLEHLFEPFNRLGAETGPVPGTGIGLTITRRLVDSMGGRLAVHSSVGRGSVFSFELAGGLQATGDPAADPPATGLAIDPEPAPEPAPLPRQLQVLYVEDNVVNVMLLQQMSMKRPQVALSVAESGAQALQAAALHRPDLLLVDMNLGDMSGLDLRRQMQAELATAGIPSVVLSADALPAQVEAALAAGFEEYITKPLKMSALLSLYDRHLAAAVAEQQAPDPVR